MFCIIVFFLYKYVNKALSNYICADLCISISEFLFSFSVFFRGDFGSLKLLFVILKIYATCVLCYVSGKDAEKAEGRNLPSLDRFLAKNTSEDNASFEQIMELAEDKDKLRHAWLYEAENEFREVQHNNGYYILLSFVLVGLVLSSDNVYCSIV